MNGEGIKLFNNKKLFLTFGCLLVIAAFFFLLKLQGVMLGVHMTMKPGKLRNPPPAETKSGKLRDPSPVAAVNLSTDVKHSNLAHPKKSGKLRDPSPVAAVNLSTDVKHSNLADPKKSGKLRDPSPVAVVNLSTDVKHNNLADPKKSGFVQPTSVPVPTPVKDTKYHKSDDTKSGECLKNHFDDILLIIIYHYPFYSSIPLLMSFYQDAFKHIVVCGSEGSSEHSIMVVNSGKGYYGYECVGEAIRRNPDYRGYWYINDDMIVNWWTFYKLDKDKFWLGAKLVVNEVHIMGQRPIRTGWVWWSQSSNSAVACEESYKEIIEKYRSSESINVTNLIQTHLSNGEGVKRCFNTWSDLFYVPKKFSDEWQKLSAVFYKNRVFLEVSVPTIMSFIELKSSWEFHYGLYLPDKYGWRRFDDGKLVWESYNYNITFIHPVKYRDAISKINVDNLKNNVIPYSKQFLKC